MYVVYHMESYCKWTEKAVHLASCIHIYHLFRSHLPLLYITELLSMELGIVELPLIELLIIKLLAFITTFLK